MVKLVCFGGAVSHLPPGLAEPKAKPAVVLCAEKTRSSPDDSGCVYVILLYPESFCCSCCTLAQDVKQKKRAENTLVLPAATSSFCLQ